LACGLVQLYAVNVLCALYSRQDRVSILALRQHRRSTCLQGQGIDCAGSAHPPGLSRLIAAALKVTSQGIFPGDSRGGGTALPRARQATSASQSTDDGRTDSPIDQSCGGRSDSCSGREVGRAFEVSWAMFRERTLNDTPGIGTRMTGIACLYFILSIRARDIWNE
jgi:hypothetical protein